MEISGRRILVTGGGGLIGSTVVDLLIEAGASRVTVVDNFDRGRRENLERGTASGRLELIEADICDRDAMAAQLENVDGLVHMAAMRITQCSEEPERARDVMFVAPFDLFYDAARRHVKKVVVASSSSIYGQAEEFPTPETHHPYNDDTLYGAAKLAGEGILRAFRQMYGLDWVALRFFNVYGARMDVHGVYTEVLVRWMERIDAGEPPVIFGDGKQSMDFTYVTDTARACVAALASDVSGEAFNIGTGRSTSLADLADLLLRVMGSDLKPEYREARGVSPVSYRLADTTKAARLLDFRAEVPLEAGLGRLVEWWRAERQR